MRRYWQQAKRAGRPVSRRSRRAKPPNWPTPEETERLRQLESSAMAGGGHRRAQGTGRDVTDVAAAGKRRPTGGAARIA